MANKFLAITDGTFTFSETENENQFYFYRNDEDVLTDIGRKPIDFYQEYIIHKFINGEMKEEEMVLNNIHSEISVDGKCIRLTICDFGKDSNAIEKKPNFLKRLLNKIFG